MNRLIPSLLIVAAMLLLARPQPFSQLAAAFEPAPPPGGWAELGTADIKLPAERRVRVQIKPPYQRLAMIRFRLVDADGNGCDVGDEQSGSMATVLVSGQHRFPIADRGVGTLYADGGAPWFTVRVADFGVNYLELNVRGQKWLSAGIPFDSHGPRQYPAACRIVIEGLPAKS